MNIASKNSKKPPVILLFGPTAVGKSDILYKTFSSHSEVINADSLQIYKYLNIGAAKPTPEQLNRLPHHMIDFLSPHEHFTAADFVRQAECCIREVHRRQRIPVLSGGSAFYLKCFLYGLPDLPGKSDEIRSKLEQEWQRAGSKALYSELLQVDPVYAAKISAHDRSRLIRALEVYRLCGHPLSSFELSKQMRDDFSLLLIGLQRPRPELYERINRRVEKMFRAGLVTEIRQLIRMGYSDADPGLRGIGYREFFEMQKNCLTLSEVMGLIKQNTRHYAKRQLTFFGCFQQVHWFHPRDTGKLTDCLTAFLT